MELIHKCKKEGQYLPYEIAETFIKEAVNEVKSYLGDIQIDLHTMNTLANSIGIGNARYYLCGLRECGTDSPLIVKCRLNSSSTIIYGKLFYFLFENKGENDYEISMYEVSPDEAKLIVNEDKTLQI